LATLIAFWPVCNCDFVNMDDDYYVTENPQVRAGLTGSSIRWAWTAIYSANWHPLTWLSLMLDSQLFGIGPWGYHLTNLLLHLTNTLLLFGLLCRMTRLICRSAFVSALFALHPLHVESVAWVSERKDLLSVLFGLCAIWAYVRYAEVPRIARYVPVVIFMGLSLLSKPMMVTLPCLLLLLDYWPLRRWPANESSQVPPETDLPPRRPQLAQAAAIGWLVLEKAPLFVLSAASCAITMVAQQRGGAVSSLSLLPLSARFGNAAISYVQYLRQMLQPMDLAFLYPLPRGGNSFVLVVGATLLLVFATAMTLALHRLRYLPVGWLWYLGTLVPVIGLVQVGSQVRADRYTYFPLIGIFLLLVWGLADLAQRWRCERHLSVIGGMILIACAAGTYKQVHYWRNSTTVWAHTLAVAEESAQAHNSLGIALDQSGNVEDAVPHYLDAIRLEPYGITGAMAQYNLGLAMATRGQLNTAIGHYEACLLSLYPPQGEVAVRVYRECLNSLGVAYAKADNLTDAIRMYTMAVEFAPEMATPHCNLGLALARQGDFVQAEKHFSEAVRLNPEYSKAHFSLAEVLVEEGRLSDAIASFRRAAQLQPDNQVYCDRLTEVLQRQPGRSSASQ
jgi:tetratricopeptide (TPR) repeat protein